MPLWVHPVLRTLQEDEESAGLIPKINSPHIVQTLTLETAGVVVKPTLNIVRILVGMIYKH